MSQIARPSHFWLMVSTRTLRSLTVTGLLSRFTADVEGLLTHGADGPGATVCFPLSRLVIGVATCGILDWGFSQPTLFPPLPLNAVVGSSIIHHGMVHFSDPTENAHSGFALDMNIWLALCGQILTDFASQCVFLWRCVWMGPPWVLVP